MIVYLRVQIILKKKKKKLKKKEFLSSLKNCFIIKQTKGVKNWLYEVLGVS